ncbi:MAG: hypothetical protein QOI35_1545 [Cryptosporangiaceae bacterium]|nr:hypothetical protein [Cryptosporangiaceae bacterium]MDQ1656203.1 hypothetical protein [Cryptosporangiaceae bacterium]
MEIAVGTAIAAALVFLYTCWLSARIRRLQARVAAARGALDAQLARRALAATRLADAQRELLPAAADHVRSAATASLTGAPDQREALENDLTHAIAALHLGAPDPAAAELATEIRRVMVARQLHNDAVRDTLDLRTRRLPRALRLGSRHPRPHYFDIAEFTLAPPATQSR